MLGLLLAVTLGDLSDPRVHDQHDASGLAGRWQPLSASSSVEVQPANPNVPGAQKNIKVTVTAADAAHVLVASINQDMNVISPDPGGTVQNGTSWSFTWSNFDRLDEMTIRIDVWEGVSLIQEAAYPIKVVRLTPEPKPPPKKPVEKKAAPAAKTGAPIPICFPHDGDCCHIRPRRPLTAWGYQDCRDFEGYVLRIVCGKPDPNSRVNGVWCENQCTWSLTFGLCPPCGNCSEYVILIRPTRPDGTRALTMKISVEFRGFSRPLMRLFGR